MKKNKIRSVIKAFGSVVTCSRLNTLGLSSLGMASIIALAPIALAPTASAEVTAPVGYVKLTFNAQSDTPFSLPMNRPKVYSGQVDSISGNVIAIENDDFTAGELVYDNVDDANGLQLEKYYLLFTTGILEGRTFDVTSNTANSITVDPDWQEDDPAEEANIQTLINDALATDNFEIRPHWTLGTAFPEGKDIPRTTSFSDIKGTVQFRTVQTGTNIPITVEYTYFDSATDDNLDGWYLPNSPESGKKDDILLSNNTFYIFRNLSSTDYSPNIIGDVALVDFKNNLQTHVVLNDNYKTIAFPVELSLAQSKLYESGVFKATESFSLRDGDTLQVYSYPITTFNKPISTEYVYFDSSNDTLDGWYLPNSPESGKKDDELVFKPGRGYIIRTVPRDTESNRFWTTPRPYNPSE